jgi:guanine deaminase
MGKDKLFLRKAVEIASNGIQRGGGPFGAVLSKGNKVISEGYNRVVLSNDPTAHAEILVIREAAAILKTHDLSECTIYCSCEPCPMCLGAIYWAGIRKVVYACDRNDAAGAGFNDELIYKELILDPSKRKLVFLKMEDAGGKEVFRIWNDFENKIPY